MAVTNRLQGFNIGAAVKPACVVATTGANITLQGAQTIDGIAVGSCERVLVKDQTDASENGIYLADSSTWIRAHDFDGAKDALPGTLVEVLRGNTYATSFWNVNKDSTATKLTIGTDDQTWDQVTQSLSGVSAFSSSLLTLASAAAWRSSDGLSLGSASTLDSTDVGLLNSTGQRWVGAQSWNKGGDLASANTLTLGSTGNYFDVTGGTTINAITSIYAGHVAKLHFDSTLQLTHSTGLVLPTAANIAVVAGDEVELVQYTTAGDWRVTGYLTSDGRSLGGAGFVSASQSQMAAENTSTALAVTPGVQHHHSGHPKAVVALSDTTSTSPTVTTTYSAIGEILATRSTFGTYNITWGSSLTNPVVVAIPSDTGASGRAISYGASAISTSITLIVRVTASGVLSDSSGVLFTIFGDI